MNREFQIANLRFQIGESTALAAAATVGGLLMLTGCDGRTSVSKEFVDPVILTDTAGKQYIVQHHIGRTFTVEPLKSGGTKGESTALAAAATRKGAALP